MRLKRWFNPRKLTAWVLTGSLLLGGLPALAGSDDYDFDFEEYGDLTEEEILRLKELKRLKEEEEERLASKRRTPAQGRGRAPAQGRRGAPR